MNKFKTQILAAISALTTGAAKQGELHNIFSKWCHANNYPHYSADELLYREGSTQDQNDFLQAFIQVWEETDVIEWNERNA